MYKKCIICQKLLPAKDFFKLSRNTDGLSAICKECCPPSNSKEKKFATIKCGECGNKKTIILCAGVRNSNCRSCGGKKSNHTMYYETRYNNKVYIESRLINSCYNTIKKGAVARGLEFSITKDDLKEYLHKNCYYCGKLPDNTFLCFRYSEKYKQEIKYQGIDRINSKKGYVKGNLRPCCIVCNHLKWDHSEDEFFESVKKIYENFCKNS